MNENLLKTTFFIVGGIVIIVLVGYGSWTAERWFNWKYSYGAKVEQRVQELEDRVDKLERFIDGSL